jgi:hypothetical protein
MNYYFKYITLTLIFLFLTACIGDKQIKKDDHNKSISYAYLGTLSKDQEIVKNELITYLNVLKNFNTEAIVEKTYPELFNVIDGRHFREYISVMSNSKDIMVEHYETNITKISKVTTFSNDTKFAKVQYSSDTKIIFLNPNLYNTETSINFLYDVLIHKYGKDNIEINVKKRSLRITKEEKMLVIKRDENGWKFIGDNAEYRRLFPTILPREILNILEEDI